MKRHGLALLTFVYVVLFSALLSVMSVAHAQALLPNGQQQFTDINGAPLIGGSVYFYVPNTTTNKTTYQNMSQTVPNTNPIILNAAGRATIWGTGAYRQIVYDQFGNLIWDQLTWAPAQVVAPVVPFGGFGTCTAVPAQLSMDLGVITSHCAVVTGASTISALGSSASLSSPYYLVLFQGTDIIMHDATALVTPGGRNITTGEGDSATLVYLGGGNWQILTYTFANGQVISSSGEEENLASNTETDLGSARTNLVNITGNTTIVDFGGSASLANPLYQLKFTKALTITYDASLMILPNAEDLQVGAGDTAVFEYLGNKNWQLISHQAFTSGGATGLNHIQVFLTNTTFTIPNGAGTATPFQFTVVAPGGGGGSSSSAAGAGGGGAGAVSTSWLTGFASGDTVTVVIGAVGTGSTDHTVNGVNGGTTKLTYKSSDIVSCTGGRGGVSGNTDPLSGGNGGTCSYDLGATGLTNYVVQQYTGQPGNNGAAPGGTFVSGGGGGSCNYGQGGQQTITATNIPGLIGTGFCGGGSGGAVQGSAQTNGGDSAPGEVIAEWSTPQ